MTHDAIEFHIPDKTAPQLASTGRSLAGSRCAPLLFNDDATTATAATAGARASGSREQLDSSVKYFDVEIERDRLYLSLILHWVFSLLWIFGQAPIPS